MSVNRNGGGQDEVLRTERTFQRELHLELLERQIKTRLTPKDLREDSSDSHVVVNCSTVQQHLHKYDKYDDEGKIELAGHNEQKVGLEEKRRRKNLSNH